MPIRLNGEWHLANREGGPGNGEGGAHSLFANRYSLFAIRYSRPGVSTGGETGAPFGRSNIPAGRPSRNASASAVFTTSAYLAFMSQRLMAWLACERSKQPSSASAMRELRLKASSTVARTQPDVVVPVTITLSQPSSVR